MPTEPGVAQAGAERIPPPAADSGTCCWPGQGPSAASAGAAVPQGSRKVGNGGIGGPAGVCACALGMRGDDG